jgi:uncharacterized protein (TIGR00730 family)
MRSVCVYCGSSSGVGSRYLEAAALVGRALADRSLELVYGGSRTGLMGAMADAALQAGGRVVGVLPKGLSSVEIAHPRLTELYLTSSLHERKARMSERADAFIALPGGYGTLDEIFEAVTWMQVGIHAKPSGLLNVSGFFDHLIAFLDHAARERLLRATPCPLLRDTDIHRLLDRLEAFEMLQEARDLGVSQ